MDGYGSNNEGGGGNSNEAGAASSSSGGNGEEQNDGTDEEEQFDINLAAAHSYMGNDLVEVSGRIVLEAGWKGTVPCVGHHGCVFPGETVPMLMSNPNDLSVLYDAIKKDKLFGLLCPDENGYTSGYGVICEVYEAALLDRGLPDTLTVKARARHRCRMKDATRHRMSIDSFSRLRPMEVVILPEVALSDPLWNARLTSIDPHRRGCSSKDARLRQLDALLTPWPLFVFDIFDYRRLRAHIRDYFSTLMFDKLPDEPVALSFWVASNLALSARDRLALFIVDDALLRLHMELSLIGKNSILCCSSCMEEIARRENIFAMSSEGVHSNYTNLGGYMHDIVTVSSASSVELTGSPSAEFSWFPGYTWTIALCRGCMSHVGWRFDAEKRSLRPQRFFGLCRNYVQPHYEGGQSPPRPLRSPPSRTPSPLSI